MITARLTRAFVGERMFKNTIKVTPVDGVNMIGFETDVFGYVTRQVASLQDKVVRDQLIAAGWTPPDRGKEALGEVQDGGNDDA